MSKLRTMHPWALLLGFAALLVMGCGGDHVERLTRWTLLAGGRADVSVTLPTHLDGLVPNRRSSFVLRTDYELPAEFRGQELTLAFTHLLANAELRVAGRRMPQVDGDAMTYYRASSSQAWHIPGELTRDGRLLLELHVQHTWTQSAWFDSVPRLSATPRGDQTFLLVSVFNRAAAIISMTVVIIVGFSYAIVFLSDRRRRTHGWFALESVAAVAYPAFVTGGTQLVFHTYDLNVMAVQLCFGTVCVVNFIHAHYKLGRPTKLFFWAWLIGSIVAVPAGGPFSVQQQAPLVVAMFVVASAYQVYFYVKLSRMRPRPPNVGIVTLAWPTAAVVGSIDFVSWVGSGEAFGGLQTGCLSIAIVSILRAATLSIQHQRTLADTDKLNEELAKRVALLEQKHLEVNHLNEELRRQITARSQQLAEALARLHSPDQVLVSLDIDEVVGGRYRVLRPIASGGMGSVYQVERLSDHRPLALKVLSGPPGVTALSRFAREAQLAAQIDHPNVVAILDIDVAERGFMFLVMEYVDGLTLSEHRDRFGDVRWALPILRQVIEGLAAVHGAGIVHRDLKPSNVLLMERRGEGPLAKLTDFGISGVALDEQGSSSDEPSEQVGPGTIAESPAARRDRSSAQLPEPSLSDRTTMDGALLPLPPDSKSSGQPRSIPPPLTLTGVVLGTPLYMAPEVTTGAKRPKPSADVFSFGVLAYQALTGEVPFPDRRVSTDQPRGGARATLRERCVELDANAARLLDACLDADPEARPSAATLAEALRRACDALAFASRGQTAV